jgi:hypothetical protein
MQSINLPEAGIEQNLQNLVMVLEFSYCGRGQYGQPGLLAHFRLAFLQS